MKECLRSEGKPAPPRPHRPDFLILSMIQSGPFDRISLVSSKAEAVLSVPEEAAGDKYTNAFEEIIDEGIVSMLGKLAQAFIPFKLTILIPPSLRMLPNSSASTLI